MIAKLEHRPHINKPWFTQAPGLYLVCNDWHLHNLYMGATRTVALKGLADINKRRQGLGLELVTLMTDAMLRRLIGSR